MGTRKEILEAAIEHVCTDRQDSYGTPEDNFGLISRLWSEYVQMRFRNTSEINLNSVDVSLMMILVKVARSATGKNKDDTWEDIAGYAACGGEIASKADENKENNREILSKLKDDIEKIVSENTYTFTTEASTNEYLQSLVSVMCDKLGLNSNNVSHYYDPDSKLATIEISTPIHEIEIEVEKDVNKSIVNDKYNKAVKTKDSGENISISNRKTSFIGGYMEGLDMGLSTADLYARAIDTMSEEERELTNHIRHYLDTGFGVEESSWSLAYDSRSSIFISYCKGNFCSFYSTLEGCKPDIQTYEAMAKFIKKCLDNTDPGKPIFTDKIKNAEYCSYIGGTTDVIITKFKEMLSKVYGIPEGMYRAHYSGSDHIVLEANCNTFELPYDNIKYRISQVDLDSAVDFLKNNIIGLT